MYQPKTPLVTPRIGLRNRGMFIEDPPEDNPWMPVVNEGPSDVKIASITPIGTIAMVPTADQRIPTPRRQIYTPKLVLNVMDDKSNVIEREDPLLKAAIYLDCTKKTDVDYNFVSNRMREISRNISELQRQYKNVLQDIPPITGIVSTSQFEKALAVYENNQVYYQDCIDEQSMDIETIKIHLTKLEHWFIHIIEPKPSEDIDEWKDRERSKLETGYSIYCDPELHTYITPLKDLATIAGYHERLQL